ncbi:MAG TPA: PKD domain-containing protein, partial [Polyangiaceae bacterium]
DTRGQEKWLRPTIDGQQAWEITYVPTLVPPGLHRIHASLVDDSLGRSLVETDAYVEVEDCIVPYPVVVQTRHVPPEPERIALVAAVMRGQDWQAWAHRRADDTSPVPRADVAQYRWDFGDGTTATSTEPRIDHVYPDEASRGVERMTGYRITVDALDEGGQTMGTGYAAVTLLNAYRDLERTAHTLQLVATVPPGPAGSTDDGSRTVAVTQRNLDPGETAQLDTLHLHFVGCDGKTTTERTGDVRSVFQDDAVAPGATLAGTLAVATSDLKDVCTVRAELEGTSRPGNLRVTAFFALDPGGARGRPLDERQAAAMAQLDDVLGDAGVVTLDTIRKLEDEGKVPRGVLAPDPFAPPSPSAVRAEPLPGPAAAGANPHRTAYR